MSHMVKGLYKIKARNSVSGHYYIPEAMPLVLCCACLILVFKYSKKAKGIYDHIVESYILPDIKGYLDPSVLTTGQTWA